MADEKRIKMSLAPVRNTADEGWHRLQAAYGAEYIRQIPDPAEVPLKRVLTAIPSPFARVHLFEAAFAFCKKKQIGGGEFHRMVSDCLDVLELLYGLEDLSHGMEIVPWKEEENLRTLKTSAEPGQQLLAQTLRLFLQDDSATANFGLQPTFYELIVEHEVLAVTSPLTLCFTAPRARELAERKSLIHPDTQKPYFTVVRPLHVRHDDFQVYLHKLFLSPAEPGKKRLSQLCVEMYEYVSESIELLKASRHALADTLLSLRNSGLPINQVGTHITDSNKDVVSLLGFPLYQRPSRQRPRLENSPIVIGSLFPAADKPIVWTGLTDSFGVTQAEKLPAPADLPPLNQRVLPDIKVRYPFVCAADFIEERLVKLPFAANSNQFYVPLYEGFPNNLDQSFLLPLKQAFFDYFPPSAIPAMAKFTYLEAGHGVLFELTIPTRSKPLKFQRAYYDSPQGEERGKTVAASMNLALFPFVSIAGRPNLKERYWAMLVDNERDGLLQSQAVFRLQFLRFSSNKLQRFTEGTAEEGLPQVDAHVRSSKAFDAGSTFFRLANGRCDLVQVDAFEKDKERRCTGLIAPAWVEREPGTREARIAIDFGTTNTHMAMRIEMNDPVPFTVASDNRQVALLSSEHYNDFPSNIPGTTIRLHHEFVPSLIGGTSRFRFPLRTATSEQLNLKSREFKPLQSVNIAFAQGIDAPRLREEHIDTRLKWSVDSNPLVLERIEAFVEELLLMVRTSLVLQDVDLQKVILTWFRPLSFSRHTQTRFEDIWKTKAQEVLGLERGRVTSLSESEAPFYYHLKKGTIRSRHTVCIDIGGGSTDVVFFRDDKPRYGSSFTFAGNELWGNGYAEIEQGTSGIVSSLRGELAELLDRAPKDPETAKLKAAFRSLTEGNAASSQEIMNFCFGADAQIGATSLLVNKSSVRCLALIHYAAIVYYCAQLMKSLQMGAPDILCFSGRGSKYLNILEVGKEKKYTAAIGKAILEHVYGMPLPGQVTLLFAEQSKEATCNGGLLKDLEILTNGSVQEDNTLEKIPDVGDGTVVESSPLTGSIDDAVVRGVAANYRHFVELLVSLSTRNDLHFRECLAITFPAALVRETLTEKVEETIYLGIKARQPKNLEDQISETLFFYPLIQNLFELGNKLARQSA